jgi:hypothetical protein
MTDIVQDTLFHPKISYPFLHLVRFVGHKFLLKVDAGDVTHTVISVDDMEANAYQVVVVVIGMYVCRRQDVSGVGIVQNNPSIFNLQPLL